ncbi:GNAT family N-acetyltransferase [Microbacterium sp. NPDC091313]
MGHIELRAWDDDDLDAIFEMMRDPQALERAAFTASDPDDRAAFDAWAARQRADPDAALWVVTEDGGFAGTAGAYTVDGEREVTYWIARNAWGHGVGTAALRLLVGLEPERPLYARVAVGNAASAAMLARRGFTELSRSRAFAPGLGREIEEIRFVLPPTLE